MMADESVIEMNAHLNTQALSNLKPYA